MREEQLTEDYLSRFPTKLHTALSDNSNFRKKFISRVVEEYPDTVVYRGIHRDNAVCTDDFLSNIDEAEVYGRPTPRPSLEVHAISVNEDPQQIITALSIPNESRPMLGIAKGLMRSIYGPADFHRVDGIPATHHNWYLFEDKIDQVVEEFAVIEYNK